MSCGRQNNQRVTQQHRESLKIGGMAELRLALGKTISGNVGQAEHGGPWEMLPPFPPATMTNSKQKAGQKGISFVSRAFTVLQAHFINGFI